MIVRLVAGLCWALVIGLAGGWLLLSPWALGLGSGGNWTDAGKAEMGAGAFLVMLALLGLLLLAADLRALFRRAGLIAPEPRPRPRPAIAQPAAAGPEAGAGSEAGAGQMDVDSLLAVLARVLADELSRRGEGQPPVPHSQRWSNEQ